MIVVQLALAAGGEERRGDDGHDAVIHWLCDNAILVDWVGLLQHVLEIIGRPFFISIGVGVELFGRLVGIGGVVRV